ncbi:MAG: ester cyclase [Deltaproteobacteria bacterium]|nr:ester cyclase [Deltaproteobacteria bacterium]
MGAVPGLAADFKPLALAETTEIVKGEGQAAIKDLYTTFFGKIATPENIDAAIAEHVGDDFKLVDAMSGLTFDKASVGAWVKGFTSMLGGMTVTVDQAIMAGDFAAFVVTNKATYKGGIEGIEAKDQQVTWKSLDIVKAKDGKFSSFMTYMNMMEMLGQLGALGGAGDKPADPAAAAPKELGVASCDAYVKAMTACLERMPEVARGPAADAFKSVVAQWEKVAAAGDAQKASLEAGCKAALDASKTSMGAACPDVKWE